MSNNPMQYRANRLESFTTSVKMKGTSQTKYWTNDKPDIAHLVDSGFFFTPTSTHPDQVQCICCGKKEHNIGDIDNMVEYHLLNLPTCALSQIVHAFVRYLESDDRLAFWPAQEAALSDPWAPKSVDLRRKTFRLFWPWDGDKLSKVTSKSLAEAGFYYSPLEPGNDRVLCMYCECPLDHWSKEDDPMAEHTKNSSGSCYFLELMRKRPSKKVEQAKRRARVRRDRIEQVKALEQALKRRRVTHEFEPPPDVVEVEDVSFSIPKKVNGSVESVEEGYSMEYDDLGLDNFEDWQQNEPEPVFEHNEPELASNDNQPEVEKREGDNVTEESRRSSGLSSKTNGTSANGENLRLSQLPSVNADDDSFFELSKPKRRRSKRTRGEASADSLNAINEPSKVSTEAEPSSVNFDVDPFKNEPNGREVNESESNGGIDQGDAKDGDELKDADDEDVNTEVPELKEQNIEVSERGNDSEAQEEGTIEGEEAGLQQGHEENLKEEQASKVEFGDGNIEPESELNLSPQRLSSRLRPRNARQPPPPEQKLLFSTSESEYNLSSESEDAFEEEPEPEPEPKPMPLSKPTPRTSRKRNGPGPKEMSQKKLDEIINSPRKSKKVKLNFQSRSKSPNLFDVSGQNIGDYEEANIDFHERDIRPKETLSPLKKPPRPIFSPSLSPPKHFRESNSPQQKLSNKIVLDASLDGVFDGPNVFRISDNDNSTSLVEQSLKGEEGKLVLEQDGQHVLEQKVLSSEKEATSSDEAGESSIPEALPENISVSTDVTRAPEEIEEQKLRTSDPTATVVQTGHVERSVEPLVEVEDDSDTPDEGSPSMYADYMREIRSIEQEVGELEEPESPDVSEIRVEDQPDSTKMPRSSSPGVSHVLESDNSIVPIKVEKADTDHEVEEPGPEVQNPERTPSDVPNHLRHSQNTGNTQAETSEGPSAEWTASPEPAESHPRFRVKDEPDASAGRPESSPVVSGRDQDPPEQSSFAEANDHSSDAFNGPSEPGSPAHANGTNHIKMLLPLSIAEFEDELNTLADSVKYLDSLPTQRYGLWNDLDGSITDFIAAMPEEEEDMTIEEWVRHNAATCGQNIRATGEKMAAAYERMCDEVIAAVERM